jgi:hypothetical protein
MKRDEDLFKFFYLAFDLYPSGAILKMEKYRLSPFLRNEVA